MNTWLGKVLRINVDVAGTYSVPADNPFVGKDGVKPEIWASGFRNPYRITLDKASKQLFIGEVGQDTWEEIDILEKGANYGWRLVEGNHCHNPATGCSFTGMTPPIAEYKHDETGGVSVLGGYVYNGKDVPSLKNKYIFGDWTGPTWYLQKAGSKWTKGKLTIKGFPAGGKITGWGEDQSGELYYLINSEAGPRPLREYDRQCIQDHKKLKMRKYFTSKLVMVSILGGVSILLLPSYILKKPKPVNDEIAPPLTLNAKEVVTGLQAPLDMAFPGNGDILVAEQAGKIRLVKNGKLAETPLLDISSKIVKTMPVDVRGY
jgi:glucose/arabinose dehydrogenase